jgi:hypothetical protein
VNLPASTVKDAISIRSANYQKLFGSIHLSRKPIPLYDFGGLQKAAGVSVLVRRQGGRQVLPGTFIARMKSGHIGVFERHGRQGNRAERLPIDERFGPTLLGIFAGAPGVAREVIDGLEDTYRKNLASQVDRLLHRQKAEE